MTAFVHPLARSLHVAAALGDAIVFLCPRRGLTFDAPGAALSQALFATPSQTRALLVDGARGAAVLEAAHARGLRMLPLYPDDVEPELLAVAPRLIPVTDRHDLDALFPLFWEQGLASAVLAQSDIGTLRAHLSRQIYAETPEGEICVLRFHDPRVLRRLRAVLDQDQSDQLFGDIIDSFVFEDGTGALARYVHAPESDA
ncbi:DUF4123 domain-containing protein [Roseobacter weihaiensis]|uniref:DUF4123 domain-containing protein n=1 Tax=Roseobacter weihaiensis TaxID=2763262 RepID=UPI001D0AB661|nr:DUF4123 domain-containing protein [Roseobacter sp. H9]